jgi:hypothetical protein
MLHALLEALERVSPMLSRTLLINRKKTVIMTDRHATSYLRNLGSRSGCVTLPDVSSGSAEKSEGIFELD